MKTELLAILIVISNVCVAQTNGCTDETACNYNPEAATLTSISIGDSYGGGVVFWIDTEQDYDGLVLISSIQNLGGDENTDWYTSNSGTTWGCDDVYIGTTNKAIGTGQQNTIEIMNGMTCIPSTTCNDGVPTNNTIAALLCDNLTEGGYDDWFLPSSMELLEMYNQRSLIDDFALINGGDPFINCSCDGSYWSSTESTITNLPEGVNEGSADPTRAHVVYFYNYTGGIFPGNLEVSQKCYNNYVRAVRSIHLNSETCEYIEEVDLGEDITTCDESITLDAGGGYDSYSWSTGENTQTIEVTESGNYNVSVNNNTQLNNDNIYSMNFDDNEPSIITGLNLDGITRYVAQDENGNSTFSALVKISSDDYGYKAIFGSTTLDGMFFVGKNYNGMDICIQDGLGCNISANYQLNPNTWQHITYVLENNTPHLYVDGEEVELTSTDVDLNISNDHLITLGYENESNNFYNWPGLIDNAQIWARALTQNEIQEFINCPPNGNEEGLIGYWNFDTDQDGVITNSSNNELNASVVGYTPLYSDDIFNYTCNTNNSNECSDSDEITVTFSLEGCTDESACNYDSNAICEDNSCYYPANGLDCDGNQYQCGDFIYSFNGPYNFNDNSFYISQDAIYTWTEANQITQDYGFYLATIHSEDEQNIIQSILDFGDASENDGSENSFWIGLSDFAEEGNWEWVTGEPYNVSYWGPNEPNSASGEENYVYLGGLWGAVDNVGLWDDLSNTDDFFFIMECGTLFSIPGCINEQACNYNPNASEDDGSCEYILEGYCDCDANILDCAGVCGGNAQLDECGVCQGDNSSCSGCIDEIACNYDSSATLDDGSCEYIEGVYLGEDIETCDESITLNAGEGYDSYSWSTGETTQEITVNESGNYSVSVNNNSNNIVENNFSYDFEGEKYIKVDNPFYENNTNSFTINTWLYIDSSMGLGYGESIIGNWQGNGNNVFILTYSGSQVNFHVSVTGQGNANIISFDVNDSDFDTWIHASVVFDGSSIYMFKNGNLQSGIIEDPFASWGQDYVPYGSNILVFGAEENLDFCSTDPDGCWYEGMIDDIQIWDIPLSEEEIQTYMNCPPLGNEEGLVGYWDFNNETANDQTSNLNNGVIIGGSTYSTETPVQNCYNECDYQEINGFNYGGYFNGSHYYLSIDPVSWNEANVICENSGGYLASISSEQENDAITSFLIENDYWIGIFQNPNSESFYEPDGGFEWITSEPVVYTNWRPGTPDNYPNGANGDDTQSSGLIYNYSGSDFDLGAWDDGGESHGDTHYIMELKCQSDCESVDEINVTFNTCGCTDQSACNYDSEANEDDGSCEYILEGYCDCDGNILDCNGDCNGTAVEDECGVCNGDNSTCADCCGIPNGDSTSCDGVCGPCNDDTSCLDECGVPNGDNSTCADCCGIPNGDGSSCDGICGPCNDDTSCLDECGVPNGDNSACADCCGVPNGDGTSCDGVCGPCNDDTSCLDECGVPNGDNSTCADCCGVPNGDGTSCDGVCGPCNDDTSCLDECGVPNGDNSSCSGCTDPTACNYDETATLDDGTCINCASIELLDGNYVELDNINFSNSDGVTISLWVHDTDFSNNPESFATYVDIGSTDSYRYVIRNRSGKIEAFFEGDGIPNTFNENTVDWSYPYSSVSGELSNSNWGSNTDGWHNITAVYCATGIRLYIDGEIAGQSVTYVYFDEFLLTEESDKRVGLNQSGEEPADATIDELRIWNRSLSEQEVEIRAGVNSQTNLNISEEINLIGYWKFDCSYLNQVSMLSATAENVTFANQYCDYLNCGASEYLYDCPEDLSSNADCNSCDPPEGCMDELACNYDPLAVINIQANCFYIDDYCPFIEYPEYYDCECKCINDIDEDGVCDELDCSPEVYNPNQDCTNLQDNIMSNNKLIKTIDVLGREINQNRKNTLLLNIYHNGDIERKYILK